MPTRELVGDGRPLRLPPTHAGPLGFASDAGVQGRQRTIGTVLAPSHSLGGFVHTPLRWLAVVRSTFCGQLVATAPSCLDVLVPGEAEQRKCIPCSLQAGDLLAQENDTKDHEGCVLHCTEHLQAHASLHLMT